MKMLSKSVAVLTLGFVCCCIDTVIAEWLWGLFATKLGLPELEFWQMFGIIVFLMIFAWGNGLTATLISGILGLDDKKKNKQRGEK